MREGLGVYTFVSVVRDAEFAIHCMVREICGPGIMKDHDSIF